MKLAYQIVTVLFWIAVAVNALLFVNIMNNTPEISLPVVLGALTAAASIPAILWVIRYFLGKELKKRE